MIFWREVEERVERPEPSKRSKASPAAEREPIKQDQEGYSNVILGNVSEGINKNDIIHKTYGKHKNIEKSIQRI